MSDDHTFDPSGSGSTYTPTPHRNSSTEVLNKDIVARKIVRRSKTKGRAVRECIEKLDMSKAAATRLVDKIFKSLYAYESYKKKEVREVLISDVEERMETILKQIDELEADIEDAIDPRAKSAMQYKLNDFLNTYDKYIVQLHKFYPGAVTLGEEEDRRPTTIQIDKIVVESPKRDLDNEE